MDQRFVLGANRAHKDPPAVLNLKVPLPLRRIWPHREIGKARASELSLRASDCDACIACTMTPEICASGRSAFARARISAAAARTASGLVRLSTTPPTSDL